MPHPDSPLHDPAQPTLHRDDPYWATCPLGSAWRTWDFLNVPKRRYTGESAKRAAELRTSIDIANARELPLEWAVAADDPMRTHTDDGRPLGRYPHSSHIHTELAIDGGRIHIDWVAVNGYGPGRSLTETHIFVDGVQAGHAWRGGCSLGFGGNDFPGVALVAPSKVLVVEDRTRNVVLYEDAGCRYCRADSEVQRPFVRVFDVADAEESSSGQRLLGSSRPTNLVNHSDGDEWPRRE